MQNAGPLLPSSNLSSLSWARQCGFGSGSLRKGLLLPVCWMGGGLSLKPTAVAGGGLSISCNSTFVCLLTASTQNAHVCLRAPMSVAAELLTPGVCKTPGLWPL